MSKVEAVYATSTAPLRWRELWRKEDWWAIWLGMGIVLVAYILFAQGSSLKWLAVTPARWSTFPQLGADLLANIPRYIANFIFWLAAFSIAVGALGGNVRKFIPSFVFIYALALRIFVLGQWEDAWRYNLEAPLVGL